MRKREINAWLERYKKSWEQKNSRAFVDLFTSDARYRETPFLDFVQATDFAAFWDEISTKQADSHFNYKIIMSSANRAVVRWTAQTTWVPSNERRMGDGIFVLTFDRDCRCMELLEWQHWQTEGLAPIKQWGVS